ncbi:MAG: DUF6273 domain-containing protein [Lachnospirales bacterium]
MVILKFQAVGQILKRKDKMNIAAFTRNELYAEFELDDVWSDKAPITAQFTNCGVSVDVFLENNRCIVPWEVLQNKGILEVCLFGGDLMTTNTVSISVLATGVIGGLIPTKASPSVYSYLTEMAEKASNCNFENRDVIVGKLYFRKNSDEDYALCEMGSETGIRILNNIEKNSDWFIKLGEGKASDEIKNGIQYENTGEFIVKNKNDDIIRLTQKSGTSNIIKGNETLKIASSDGQISFDNEDAGIDYTKSQWSENFKQLNITTEKGVNIQAKDNSYFQSGEKKLVIGNDFNSVEFRTDGVAKFKNVLNAKDLQINGASVMNTIDTKISSAMDTVDIKISQAFEDFNKMTWEKVQNIVKLGFGENYFPVGTQLSCNHNDYGEIVWDVVAHNNNLDPSGNNRYSMTLLTHNVIDKFIFDTSEALYYCESGIEAGTYYFTLPQGFYENYGGGKSYYFNISNAVAEGGVIVLAWNGMEEINKIKTYNSDRKTLIEETTLTEGTEGTYLGTANGKGENINHISRVTTGSSNWRESNIRQILNSDKIYSELWLPQTKFDMPPTKKNGFMLGLEEDFKNVIGEVENITATNSIYEFDGNLNDCYMTTDKFWLPSQTEITGVTTNGISEGEQFEFYKGLTGTERIKYSSDSVATKFNLRSTSMVSCSSFFVIDQTTGGLASYGAAYGNNGLVVACTIY